MDQYVGALPNSITGAAAALLQLLNSFVSFAVIAGVFAAIYKIMPDTPIQWRDVALSGAVTSALFTSGKYLLGLYLGRASYGSTYGAAASIVVLIAWIYYSGQIFFLGAEFTRAFAKQYGSQPSDKPDAMVKAATDTAAETKPKVIVPGGEVLETANETRGPRYITLNRARCNTNHRLCGISTGTRSPIIASTPARFST